MIQYLTNVVTVTGGNAMEREIVSRAVHWCIKKMMPRTRTLDIEVKLKNLGSAWGYCMEGDTNRTFELELQKGLGLYDLISTVCHEMVHVKQYYRREMRHTDRGMMWKTAKIPDKTAYMDLPWEKEAFRMEKNLAIECFQNI